MSPVSALGSPAGPGRASTARNDPEKSTSARRSTSSTSRASTSRRRAAHPWPRTVDDAFAEQHGGRMLLHRFTPVWLSGSLAATGPSGLRVHAVSYAIDSVTTRVRPSCTAPTGVLPSRRKSSPFRCCSSTCDSSPAMHCSGRGRVGVDARISGWHDEASPARSPRHADRPQLPGAPTRRGSPVPDRRTPAAHGHTGAVRDLQVVTWLDTVLLIGLVLAVLAALMLVGRTMRRRNRRKVGLDLVDLEDAERPSPEMVGA